jgi:hypothetical protein
MVDSGNLAACLLIIKQGCYDLLHQPVWGAERWRGLTDTILLLEESLLPPPPLASPPVGGEEGGATAKALRDHLAALRQRLLDAGDQPNQWPILMNYLMTTGQEELNQHMLNLLAAKTDMPAIPAYAGTVHEWRIYLDRLYEHLRDWQREMDPGGTSQSVYSCRFTIPVYTGTCGGSLAGSTGRTPGRCSHSGSTAILMPNNTWPTE